MQYGRGQADHRGGVIMIQDWNRLLVKLAFGTDKRFEFYETLAMLMDNGTMMADALRKMYDVETDGGKKPNEPVAIVIKDCLLALENGRPISAALQKFISQQELALIAAGERSGNIGQSFGDIKLILESQSKIIGTLAGGIAYPTFIGLAVAALLRFIATDLVPKFSTIVDPASWTGAAANLYSISKFVTSYGAMTVALLIALIAAIAWSLPRLGGGMRIRLDELPIYSLYRQIQGTSTLLAISVLLSAGVQLKDALEMLSRSANPYLKERIDAILYNIRMGANLGEALYLSGMNFPDRKSIAFMRLLATVDRFDLAIKSFSVRWMEKTIKRTEKVSKVILISSLLVMTAVFMLVIFGVNDMQSAIQAAASR